MRSPLRNEEARGDPGKGRGKPKALEAGERLPGNAPEILPNAWELFRGVFRRIWNKWPIDRKEPRENAQGNAEEERATLPGRSRRSNNNTRGNKARTTSITNSRRFYK